MEFTEATLFSEASTKLSLLPILQPPPVHLLAHRQQRHFHGLFTDAQNHGDLCTCVPL